MRACVCACVRACVSACVSACVRACVRQCMRPCVRVGVVCVRACVYYMHAHNVYPNCIITYKLLYNHAPFCILAVLCHTHWLSELLIGCVTVWCSCVGIWSVLQSARGWYLIGYSPYICRIQGVEYLYYHYAVKVDDL